MRQVKFWYWGLVLLCCFASVAYKQPSTSYLGSDLVYAGDTLRTGAATASEILRVPNGADVVALDIDVISVTDSMVVKVSQSQNNVRYAVAFWDTVFTTSDLALLIEHCDVMHYIKTEVYKCGSDSSQVQIDYSIGAKK